MKKKHILITLTVVVSIASIYLAGQSIKHLNIRNEVSAAFEEFESVNDRAVQRIDENLLSSGMASALLVQSKSDSCKEITRYAGFTPVGSQLTCVMTYLRFYETEQSIGELDIAFGSNSELQKDLQIRSYRNSNTDCPDLYGDHETSFRADNEVLSGEEVVARYGGARYITLQYIPFGSLGSNTCELRNQVRYTSSDYDSKKHSKYTLIEGFDASDLQPQSDGFWLEYEIAYFSKRF